jgi:ubiquinone/menaquinone biosynthesis C-methylase UbiE
MTAAPKGPVTDQAHYSYRVYADPTMANAFESLRFSGPIGTLLAEDQAGVIGDFLGVVTGRAILDVGTGAGRGAIALAKAGAVVTGVDASEEMLRVARVRADEEHVAVTFQQGDAHALGFADGSFDVAVCLRVLMHTPGWKQSLGELCRVSRHQVLFDYPSACSAAALQAFGRRLAAWFGSGTEAYRVFTDHEMRRELEAHGFRVERTHRQFVLPIALHKAVGSRGFTRGLEGALAKVGLLRLLGSPVTVVAVRCES